MERNEILKDIIVKVIPKALAKDYILKYHYMRTFPNPKFCFGVILNNALCGVLTFGNSTSTREKVVRIIPRINDDEFIEMQRMHLMIICLKTQKAEQLQLQSD